MVLKNQVYRYYVIVKKKNKKEINTNKGSNSAAKFLHK